MSYDPYASSAANSSKDGSSKALTFKWGDTRPKFYKIAKSGEYGISIIPFIIKTKKHPAIQQGASVGDEVYALDYWRHAGVGPNKAFVVCPKRTWNKPCPICELADQMKLEHGPESKQYTDLLAKHRVVYNVIAADEDELQVMEESYALFETELIKVAKAKAVRKGQDFIRFAKLSEGLDVLFSAERTTFQKAEFNKYSAFDFEKRETPRKASLVDKSYALDEFLNQMSYDDLNALLYGASDDEEEEISEPKEVDTPKAVGPKCPNDKRFAKDFDNQDETCGECDLYVECKRANRAL